MLVPLQLWRLQEWVQAKIDPRLAALADAPKPTIGFHIRGGDKGEEDVLRVSASCTGFLVLQRNQQTLCQLKVSYA